MTAAMKKRKGSPAPPPSAAMAALRFLAALHLIVLSSPAREASAGKSRVGRGRDEGDDGLMWACVPCSPSSLIV